MKRLEKQSALIVRLHLNRTIKIKTTCDNRVEFVISATLQYKIFIIATYYYDYSKLAYNN